MYVSARAAAVWVFCWFRQAAFEFSTVPQTTTRSHTHAGAPFAAPFLRRTALLCVLSRRDCNPREHFLATIAHVCSLLSQSKPNAGLLVCTCREHCPSAITIQRIFLALSVIIVRVRSVCFTSCFFFLSVSCIPFVRRVSHRRRDCGFLVRSFIREVFGFSGSFPRSSSLLLFLFVSKGWGTRYHCLVTEDRRPFFRFQGDYFLQDSLAPCRRETARCGT